MPWYFAVVEREHELQNPTSPEKIRLLGKRLQLGPQSRVLDMASGRGGPALVLASAFGCRITCVEQSEEFAAAARRRIQKAGLDGQIELVHADARQLPVEAERYDAALCLGASFVWKGLRPTLAALTPAVRPGGFVAVGEPYWRVWPLPGGFKPDLDDDFCSLPETVRVFEQEGLEPVAVIDASLDDWDRYESLHWLAAEQWLHANPDDPQAPEIKARCLADRDRYLRWQRDLLGWAIIAGRKR